ncbi:SDR family oxidoreductase [Amycolatopsis carbonis]|uniref:SDR family oxidoreductase n=1 Tax=Amycolatopsis carbonis TaxID=715471 RepID=A0A9Y2N2M9_9PSEU|nr:SDR family oxidoreductase [Amycolatopsis sp. 2-15]WIX84192.1 SDR family oxidoreductase [Amycolatopsis sp. 2-15]
MFRDVGARVVVCARSGAGPDFVRCDVREPAEVTRLVSFVVTEYGRLDVLVNNSGGAPFADTATASARFHEKVVALNLLAPLGVAQAAIAVMQQQETGGVIVNVSSVSATRPSPRTAAYGAAKAGLDNLTATLAVEWAPKVRVNALDVGMVGTLPSLCDPSVAATVPLGRLATPAEVGACAVLRGGCSKWTVAACPSRTAGATARRATRVRAGRRPSWARWWLRCWPRRLHLNRCTALELVLSVARA